MSAKNRPLACVILAAGKGQRMKSKGPKVMNPLVGWPMIKWLLESVRALNPERVVVVVGPGMDDLAQAVHPCEVVIQPQQDGTGSALKCAMNILQKFSGDVLVLLGDTPMITTQTLWHLIQARHEAMDVGIAVLAAEMGNPTGYGRLLLDKDGNVHAIREEKDASPEEKQVRLVNTGAFCMDSKRLERWLGGLNNRNAQKEFYITDLPEIAAQDGYKTRVHITFDNDEVRGCNTRAELFALERIAQQRMRDHFMDRGVAMQDPQTVYFHFDTVLGEDVVIEPNVYFGPGVEVGDKTRIRAFSHLEGVKIGKNATIGPFARIRPGTVLGDDVRIGLPMDVRLRHWTGNRGTVSVDRGPLTYSLLVGVEETSEPHAEIEGEDAWPARPLWPATPWNYGLDLDGEDPRAGIEVVRRQWPVDDRPWFLANAPLELRAPARRIPEWQLDHRNLVDEVGESPVRSEEPRETIRLVPMGAARLRISAFPVIGSGDDAHTWQPPSRPLYRASASHTWWSDTADAVADGVVPASSSDGSIPRHTFWSHKGTSEWLLAEFDAPRTLDRAAVYWFDDSPNGGGCRLPASWKLRYRDASGAWRDVSTDAGFGIAADRFNEVRFEEVTTSALRLEVELRDDSSGGVLEWRIGAE